MWRNRHDVQIWKRWTLALLVAIGASSLATAQQNAMLNVSPGFIQFGTTEVGDTGTRSFTVRNTGNTDLSLVLSSTSGPFTVGGDATITVEAGMSESVQIRYSPTLGDIPPLTDTGSILIAYTVNAGTDSATVDTMMVRLRGFARDRSRHGGGDDGDIDVSTGLIDFGTVDSGDSETRTLIVSNLDDDGSVSVRIVAPDDPFRIVSGGGSFVLDDEDDGNGDSRSIRIRFSPDSSGLFSDTLLVVHGTGGATDTIYVRLIGRGRTPTDTVSAGRLVVAPGSLQFGSVRIGDMETRVVTLLNVGGTATISGRIDSAMINTPFAVIGGADTFSIAAGGSHTVLVRFMPTAPGSYDDLLPIRYTMNGASATQMIPLFGRGIDTSDDDDGDDDIVRSSTVTVDFGTVPRNASVTRTITLWSTNTSDSISAVGTIGGSVNAPFSIVDGGGSFTLGAGTTRQVTLRFMPTANGAFTDTVMAMYTRYVDGMPSGNMDTLRIRLVGRSFTGRGADTIVVDVGSPVIDFGGGDTVAVGDTDERTITVLNPGNATIIVTPRDVNAPFTVNPNDLNVMVNPGASATIRVRFTPQVPGIFADTVLLVTDNGFGVDTSFVFLNGVSAVTDVRDSDGTLRSKGISLTQVRPNPVRTSATIGFTLPSAGKATLELFAVDGRKIATIVDERLPAGSRNATFDASSLESGVYFYRLTVDGVTLTQQMTVAR